MKNKSLKVFNKITLNKSDVETILILSSTIEQTLRNKWGADGHGLVPLASSVAHKIGLQTFEEIKELAIIRNNAAHQTHSFKIRSRSLIINKASKIQDRLDEPTKYVWFQNLIFGNRRKWMAHSFIWFFFPITFLLYIPWILLKQKNRRWSKHFLERPLLISFIFYFISLLLIIRGIHSENAIYIIGSLFYYVFLCVILGWKFSSGERS